MATSTNKVITLRNVRFSYLYVFQPYQGENGSSYCGHFILEPTDPQVKQVVEAMKEIARAKWGDEADVQYAALKGKDRLALHLGDTSKPGDDAYKGKVFLSGSSKTRPTVVETRGGANVALIESDGRPRSGDYGNAIVALWIQDNKYGKRINCQIQGVQYVRKGAPLGGGGRVANVDEFGVEPSDADGAAPDTAAASGDAPDFG